MTDLGAVRPFTTSARSGHHGLAERIRAVRARPPLSPSPHARFPCRQDAQVSSELLLRSYASMASVPPPDGFFRDRHKPG